MDGWRHWYLIRMSCQFEDVQKLFLCWQIEHTVGFTKYVWCCYTGDSCAEVNTEADSNKVTERLHDDKSRPFVCDRRSVRFLSTVNSAVLHKATWRCKSFATNSTFKRFLSWMTSPVYCQLTATFTAFATFCAPVVVCVNIHMYDQAALR